MNPILTKSRTAGAAVEPRRIVKHDSSDGVVVHGAAATDALCGITAELGAASGARVDVHLMGLVEVDYGGEITRGAPLTSDASGKAVSADIAGLAEEATVRIIGYAEVSGVAGDIGLCMIAPGVVSGGASST